MFRRCHHEAIADALNETLMGQGLGFRLSNESDLNLESDHEIRL